MVALLLLMYHSSFVDCSLSSMRARFGAVLGKPLRGAEVWEVVDWTRAGGRFPWVSCISRALLSRPNTGDVLFG